MQQHTPSGAAKNRKTAPTAVGSVFTDSNVSRNSVSRRRRPVASQCSSNLRPAPHTAQIHGTGYTHWHVA